MTTARPPIDIKAKLEIAAKQISDTEHKIHQSLRQELSDFEKIQVSVLVDKSLKILESIIDLDTNHDMDLVDFMNRVALLNQSNFEKTEKRIQDITKKNAEITLAPLHKSIQKLKILMQLPEAKAGPLQLKYNSIQASYKNFIALIANHSSTLQNSVAEFHQYLKAVEAEFGYFQKYDSKGKTITSDNGHSVFLDMQRTLFPPSQFSKISLELFRKNLRLRIAKIEMLIIAPLLANLELKDTFKQIIVNIAENLHNFESLSSTALLDYKKSYILERLTQKLKTLLTKSPIIKPLERKDERRISIIDLYTPAKDKSEEHKFLKPPESSYASGARKSGVLSGAGAHSFHAETKPSDKPKESTTPKQPDIRRRSN